MEALHQFYWATTTALKVACTRPILCDLNTCLLLEKCFLYCFLNILCDSGSRDPCYSVLYLLFSSHLLSALSTPLEFCGGYSGGGCSTLHWTRLHGHWEEALPYCDPHTCTIDMSKGQDFKHSVTPASIPT